MSRPLILACLRQLGRDRRAVAAIEFAYMAPLFLLVTMGFFDLAYQSYVKATLSGIVEQAGRDATLQRFASDQRALDAEVRAQVENVYRGLNVTIERKAYSGFSEISKPERFTDANGNGSYDSGECFVDSNGSGRWDADAGSTGNGNANQVVLFTAKIHYMRIFPLWKMLGQPQNKEIAASTLLKNQPYSSNENTPMSIC